jgi:hypothetical protein
MDVREVVAAQLTDKIRAVIDRELLRQGQGLDLRLFDAPGSFVVGVDGGLDTHALASAIANNLVNAEMVR